VTSLLWLVLAVAPAGWSPLELWEAWPTARFVSVPAPCFGPEALEERLRALAARHPGTLRLEEAGRSAEGRPIHLLALGRGPVKVLLWSQMHGDEPSATPALLDLADFLLTRTDPEAGAILEATTLLLVPMLNPDGAARYQRRNAQGIDVNRDALNLATPEGRLLEQLRDRHQPVLGFNLHDQDRRTLVGDSGRLASIALLAVSGDAQGTLTPGRLRAKRACAAVVQALEGFVAGRLARYDEDWSPRAFGDNLTAWGTPVVLIESGAPADRPFTDLTRLNFVALLAVLRDLARDDLSGHDPAVYDGLQRNRTDEWADVALTGGEVLQPGAALPARADLAFNALVDDRAAAGCPGWSAGGSKFVEVGDARTLAVGRVVPSAGLVATPGFVASVAGFGARSWLDPGSLDALARLGVVALRWHVSDAERAAAERVVAAWAGPGRPAIRFEGPGAPASLLWLDGPPERPRSRALGDLLDALTRSAWRARAGARPFAQVLGLLQGRTERETGPPPVPLTLGAAASFLVLRPGAGPIGFGTELAAIWIDGRELTGPAGPDTGVKR
jgi:hypothetical protein